MTTILLGFFKFVDLFDDSLNSNTTVLCSLIVCLSIQARSSCLFFHHINFTRFFFKNCFYCYCFDQGQFFVLFLRKKFQNNQTKKLVKSQYSNLKKIYFTIFIFFGKKNNLTVLDDLAAMTRMTGGLNVGGNQTFPGPFYVR